MTLTQNETVQLFSDYFVECRKIMLHDSYNPRHVPVTLDVADLSNSWTLLTVNDPVFTAVFIETMNLDPII